MRKVFSGREDIIELQCDLENLRDKALDSGQVSTMVLNTLETVLNCLDNIACELEQRTGPVKRVWR